MLPLHDREATVAPSNPRDNPVRFTIVPQDDGTFWVEASDGELSDVLVSFGTLIEAEAWLARLKGSHQ